MLISFLIIIGIIAELKICGNIKAGYIAFLLFLYCGVTIVDLYSLLEVFDLPFHLSDPRNWYFDTKKMTFEEIWKDNYTYAFFYTIEWIYIKLYETPIAVSFLVRVNNILLAIYTYLLLTRKSKKIGTLDFVLMLNPYLIFILNRNMRDVYILFFIAVIFLAFNFFENGNKIRKIYGIIALAIMSTIRPICILPFIFILIINVIKKRKTVGFVLLTFVFIIAYLNFDQLFQTMLNQSIGVALTNGEDTSDLEVLFDNRSFSLLIPLFNRYFVGSVAMFFTPHPTNYYNSWIQFRDLSGTYLIYSWFDNVIIILGSIFCYLFVVPKIFDYFFSCKFWKNNAFVYIILYFIIYVVGYLGVTDIRNHHFVYFFSIASLINLAPRLSHKYLAYFIVGSIFVLISII